jgi:hypothetical protein
LLLVFIFNDFEDTLVHHYDRSIFAPLGHESYFYPDWTRKYEGYLPPMCYDGWHGFKILRQFALFNAGWFLFLAYDYRRRRNWLLRYIIYLVIYGMIVYALHYFFYGNLLLTG